MMIKSILLFAIVLSALSFDYCETISDRKVFITQGQVQILNLSSLIRGYDLAFSAVDTSAQLYSAYQVTQKQYLDLGDYNYLKSLDVRASTKISGMGNAALLAQKGNDKQIAVWMGSFEGNNKLPSLKNFKYLTLPGVTANCFDFRVADDAGTLGVLNCQTSAQSEEQPLQDLICTIGVNDVQLSLKNCKLFSSLSVSLSRKSKVMNLNGKVFLFSANLDLTAGLESISYISVYYLNSNNQFQFSNIIDGSSLDDPIISVADFVITKDNTIIVADSWRSRIIYYRYTLDNEIEVTRVINFASRPLALAYAPTANTILVATKEAITEHNVINPTTIISKYEVDPADSLISSVQVSNGILAFTTKNKNLYIYERQQHKLNYLLTKVQILDSTQFILSSSNNVIFTFNSTICESVYVSQPSLQIKGVQQSKTINVVAKSTTSTCTSLLELAFTPSTNAIIHKQTLQDKSFKVDPVAGLDLPLSAYFGGANLEYSVSETQEDFDIKINHFSNYQIVPSFESTEVNTILHLTKDSFYYIGLNTIKESAIYIDLCKQSKGEITCSLFSANQTISKTKKSVESITAMTRSNGASVVVWSYKYSGIAEWFYVERKTSGYSIHGYPLSYSNIYINDNYFIFLTKTGKAISILFQSQPYYFQISESLFSAEELKEVEYFYPREVYIDSSNSNVIYVKLPTKIAKFILLDNHKAEYVGIAFDFGVYELDRDWSVIFDSKRFITFKESMIRQWHYDNVKMQFVNTQSFEYKGKPENVYFDRNSKLLTLAAMQENNQKIVKIMRPFIGSVDFQYCELPTTGSSILSGNWLLDANSKSVHFISSSPTLSIQSHLPEDIFKEDFNLPLGIKSKTDQQKTTAQIEGVNFPVSIKDISSTSVIKLPSSAQNVEIALPVQGFFNGSIESYQLDCPMCGGSRFHLYSHLRFAKSVEETAAVVDFVNVGDRIVGLTSRYLFVMNSNQQVITRSPLNKVSCTNLEYHKDVGLLVFCGSETGEQILKYSINKDKFYIDAEYIFRAEHSIHNFDEMFATTNNEKEYLFILDNDETVDNNNKRSTIKVFDITDDLLFLTEWDSSTFGTDKVYPINDFQLKEDMVFVTLGNFGIGYGKFADSVLTNVACINLASVPDVKAIFLDDSFFKQVEYLGYSQQTNDYKLFITSSNSLHMVISLTMNDKAFSFNALKQVYFRYGTLRLLNWHQVTKDSIFLSYYNQQIQQVSVVYYKRTEQARTHFVDSVAVRVSKNQVKYHEAFLTSENRLIVSHISDNLQEGQMVGYNIYDHFTLWISYETPGDFEDLHIIALNHYSQSIHTQKVKFNKPLPPPPPNPDEDGLKWYVVVIACTVVLIVVGTAYGMFRYMKKKRQEKSVSLLTEKEDEDDEKQVNEKDAQLNRTSINDP